MRRLPGRATYLALALGSVACQSSDAVIAESLSIEVAPASLTAGGTATVSITDDGDPISRSRALVEQLVITPDGVLEHIAGDRFRTVGAGSATLLLRAKSYELSTTIEVGCPTRGSGTVVHNGTVSDEEWLAQAGTHRVEGELLVQGSLTIGACAKLEMAAGASIVVGRDGDAKLVVRGTAENPVVMAGALGARWQGIRLHVDNASGSALRHLTVRDADGLADGSEQAVLDLVGDANYFYDQAPVAVQGVRITNCADVGIRVRNLYATANLRWTDNHVSGCAGYPLSVDGGSMGALPGGAFTGNGVDAIKVVGGWTGPYFQYWRNFGIPYEIQDWLWTAPDPDPLRVVSLKALGGVYTLIEAGAVFRFRTTGLTRAKVGLFIGGNPETFDPATTSEVRFVALGTITHPIRFTSAAGTPAPGDWIGLVFMPNVRLSIEPSGTKDHMSQLRNVVVEYAGALGSGVTDANNVERQGGIITLAQVRNLDERLWFIEGCTVRKNLGYGWVAPASDMAWCRLSRPRVRGFTSCFCENELGTVGPDAQFALPPCTGVEPAAASCNTCLPGGQPGKAVVWPQ